ncbi:MAG: carboxypeptidase regulatory-like domain-containing protein [Gemmatimonadota bacterium]
MRIWLLTLVFLQAPLASAQSPATQRAAPSASITGVVYDSIARKPLASATVQLAGMTGSPRFGGATMSDSLGRFTFANVPDGRYTLGFIHPVLDSLGLEPIVREFSVQDHAAVRADLSVPSAARLRAAICGPASSESGAALVGIVRDAKDGSPLPGVAVTGEWVELTFTPSGLVRRVPRMTSTTGENGWFAICNVPRPGSTAITATRGADSTDRIDVEVTGEELVRSELYLGPSRTRVVGDTTTRADTGAPAPRHLRVGDGRLSGTVVAAVGGAPLTNAQVSIVDGPQARANARGEWTIADAPAGTRLLEVRAVGYYPVRRRVDVIAGAAPLRFALSTFKAVLDTVRVTAQRNVNTEFAGFEQRRRSNGSGRFLTSDDIARRGAIFTSDIFKTVPGLKVWRDSLGENAILMRSAFGDPCSPSIYVDGHVVPGMSGGDLDAIAEPKRVAGIEVYDEANVPPLYTTGMTGCGSIVIWLKP